VDYSGILNNLNSLCPTVYRVKTCLPSTSQLETPLTPVMPMDLNEVSHQAGFDLTSDFGNDHFGNELLDIPDFESLNTFTDDFDLYDISQTLLENKSDVLPIPESNCFESISPLSLNCENPIDLALLLSQCESDNIGFDCDMPVLSIVESNDGSSVPDDYLDQQNVPINSVMEFINLNTSDMSTEENATLEVSFVEENGKELLMKIEKTPHLINSDSTIDLGQFHLEEDSNSDDDLFQTGYIQRKPRRQNPQPVVKGSSEYLDKRTRNNIAVRKSRMKAKKKNKEHEGLVKMLTQENLKLQNKVELLSKELNIIKGLFSHFGKKLSKDVQDKLEIIDLM